MRNEANQKTVTAKREEYMAHRLSHAEYYQWLGTLIGVTQSDLPVDLERIRKSADPALNDIPLDLWDSRHIAIQQKAFYKGINWSMSDTVCTLKELAKRLAAI